MRHILKKSEKKAKSGSFSSVHQKIARLNSGNTITAKAYLKKLDKKKLHGTKTNSKK